MDALAIWHQHHNEIALLLTDMVMPAGLNGQELAEKFKAQKHDLKIIYTSGYSVEIAGRGLCDMEGISFLQKPYDSKTLALAVVAAWKLASAFFPSPLGGRYPASDAGTIGTETRRLAGNARGHRAAASPAPASWAGPA